MKSRKRMLTTTAVICAVTLHTGIVSLASAPVNDTAGVIRTAEGQQMQESIYDMIIEKVGQIVEEKKEEVRAAEEARLRAEEEARLRAEEEARLKAEEEARLARGQEEAALLAALIYCEAGGEPYEGQVAVGAVVMNRVKSGAFPNSIREVIYQSGQFGPAITGKLERVLANGNTTDSCRQAASEAMAGVSPVGGAIYFGDGQDFGQKIGGHWFHS